MQPINVRRLRQDLFGVDKIPFDYTFDGQAECFDAWGKSLGVFRVIVNASKAQSNGRKISTARIFVKCKGCGATIPAGRIAQHYDTKICQSSNPSYACSSWSEESIRRITNAEWQWWHTGGGIYCWYFEDVKEDRSYYVGNSCGYGADIMHADGCHIESATFSSQEEAVQWACDITAGKIAREFATLLIEDLGKDTMLKVVNLNRSESDQQVCHSHDFCDANVLMETAFGGIATDEDDCQLWGKAWDIAQKNEFWLDS